MTQTLPLAAGHAGHCAHSKPRRITPRVVQHVENTRVERSNTGVYMELHVK